MPPAWVAEALDEAQRSAWEAEHALEAEDPTAEFGEAAEFGGPREVWEEEEQEAMELDWDPAEGVDAEGGWQGRDGDRASEEFQQEHSALATGEAARAKGAPSLPAGARILRPPQQRKWHREEQAHATEEILGEPEEDDCAAGRIWPDEFSEEGAEPSGKEVIMP